MSIDYSQISHWYYQIGINVLAADIVKKIPTEEWSKYQDKSVPINLFEQNKRNNGFASRENISKILEFLEEIHNEIENSKKLFRREC